MSKAVTTMKSLLKARQTFTSSGPKSFSSNANSITLDLGSVFSTHCEYISQKCVNCISCSDMRLIKFIFIARINWLVCEAPSSTVTATKDELLAFFKEMYTMRRVEITNDTEYKVWAAMISFGAEKYLLIQLSFDDRHVLFAVSAIYTMDRKLSLVACRLLWKRRILGSLLIAATV